MAQMVKNLPECRRPGYDPWVSKIPWRRKWQPTPVFLPGRFHGLRSLVGYSPWSLNESEMTEWLSTHTHCVRSSWFYREYKYGIKVLTEALTWYKYSRKSIILFGGWEMDQEAFLEGPTSWSGVHIHSMYVWCVCVCINHMCLLLCAVRWVCLWNKTTFSVSSALQYTLFIQMYIFLKTGCQKPLDWFL